MKRLLAALLGLCASSCAETRSEPATQVVVVVGGESALALLDVRVYDAEGKTLSSKRSIDLRTRAPGGVPTSFSIIPPEGEREGTFRLVVQGFTRSASGQKEARARRELTAAFSPDKTSLLPLILSGACALETCGCTEDRPCAQSCDPMLGQCAPLADYGALAEIEPGRELEQLRDGVGGCARGTFPQADGSCRDLDECAFVLDECSREPPACLNLAPEAGRYKCVCPAGYRGTGEADNPCRL